MRRLLPAVAAALACVACTEPVFDPELSASVATIRASHLVGSTLSGIGADLDDNGKPDFDLAEDRFVFMPVKMGNTIDASRGFVSRKRPYDSWTETWYLWQVGEEVRWMGTPAGYNEDDGLRWRWPVTLKNGTSLAAIQFEGGDQETWIDRIWAQEVIEYADWSPGYHSGATDLEPQIKSGLGLATDPVVVGLSVKASVMPSQERLHALVREGSMFSEAEADIWDPTPPFLFVPTVPPNYALPFLDWFPRHVVYVRDSDPANFRSFAQWLNGDGRWITWTWDPPGPVNSTELTGIDHRIDTVLTVDPTWGWPAGSYLLSTEDGMGRVYRYDGSGSGVLVAEFGIGLLGFIGEMYTLLDTDSQWRLLFSRTIVERTADPMRIRFDIRGIRTRDLLNLFGL